MSNPLISIGSATVGAGHPCFVIAEAGVNHNGSLDAALKLVDAAADAGACSVKFQTFEAIKLVTKHAQKADYQKQNTGNNDTQLEMLQQLELSHDQHRELVAHCQRRGILFLSTPFDEESADFLNDLGVCAFKIPSGEVTNLSFLRHVAQFGKPMIVSTGMCRLSEVETAVETLEAAGCQQFVLLHCVSNYPADPRDVNLKAMDTLAAAFQVPVGYSDHTLGLEASLAAVARGACVIEKHFTLDRTLPGPDHAASLEPHELKQLVSGMRIIEQCLSGTGRKAPVASEVSTAAVARRSLVAATDLPEGTILDETHIAVKRPGTGLPPSMRPHLLKRRLRRSVSAGSLLTLDDIS